MELVGGDVEVRQVVVLLLDLDVAVRELLVLLLDLAVARLHLGQLSSSSRTRLLQGRAPARRRAAPRRPPRGGDLEAQPLVLLEQLLGELLRLGDDLEDVLALAVRSSCDIRLNLVGDSTAGPARSLSSMVCSLRCRKTFSSAIPACSTNSSRAAEALGRPAALGVVAEQQGDRLAVGDERQQRDLARLEAADAADQVARPAVLGAAGRRRPAATATTSRKTEGSPERASRPGAPRGSASRRAARGRSRPARAPRRS